ncbi:MAG: ATP-binding protein [Verrucomicrobia bacterium]|nr:ATP-binding protein [Verrucomicrobiota bacterium]
MAFAPAATVASDELLCKIVVVRVGGIKVDGPWTTNTSGTMSLRLPKPDRLEISYGPIDSAANQPLRLLRKLEGYDPEWQEAGGQMQRAHMQLMIMILDASNRVLSHQRFTLTGQSDGWRGSLEQSEFSLRRESHVLPLDADRLQVLLTAENWTVLGCAAITDFRAWLPNAAGQAQNIWPDPHIEEGESLDEPTGDPRYWRRSGFGSRMAQVLTLPPPAKGRALAIRDDDVRISATWQSEVPLGSQARAGDTLTLSWREAFSVGIGERSRATFNPLAPGHYVFRVRTATPLGAPVGRELALTIVIPQALWKRPAFVVSILLLAAAGIALMVWTLTHRRMAMRLRQVEHYRWLERERLRIAQDIHDDLGASLTHINLLSQSVIRKMTPDHAASDGVHRIRSAVLALTQKLDEIVWAVSPRHDTTESLINYLTSFAEEFLGAAGIRVRIHAPMQLPTWTLAAGLRHNVFLATKEVLHNVVRHANATEVHLRLECGSASFHLAIEDNGRGFETSAVPTPPVSPSGRYRHGLAGVRGRIESLGGHVSLESAPGRGTRIALSIPVDETHVRSPNSPGAQIVI